MRRVRYAAAGVELDVEDEVLDDELDEPDEPLDPLDPFELLSDEVEELPLLSLPPLSLPLSDFASGLSGFLFDEEE